jgi:hypothetical protein
LVAHVSGGLFRRIATEVSLNHLPGCPGQPRIGESFRRAHEVEGVDFIEADNPDPKRPHLLEEE